MRRIVILLIFLLSLNVFTCFAKDILVGDLIKIKLSSTSIKEEQIRQAFDKFEIEEIDKVEGGYEVSFRSYETGEKTVNIGGKTLKIKIKSILNEKIETHIKEPPFVFPVTYTLIGLGILVFIGGIVFFVIHLKKVREKMVSPYDEFLKNIERAGVNDFFFVLTLAFKRFFDRKFGLKIMGKTSSEIIEEISQIKVISDDIEKLREWLKFADMIKYARVIATEDEKNLKKEELIEIVKSWKDK